MKRLRDKVIRQNQIYIVPSGKGFLFLGLVVVMILTAATYNNNLIFILSFFLFSAFFVSMLQTHYNLKGVRLRFVGSEEAFEGDSLALLFHIEQSRPRWKKGLEIRTRSKRFKTLSKNYEEVLPSEGFKATRVEILAWKRGEFDIPEMVLETYIPLGLFRAWKIFRPQGKVLIYPKPVPGHALSPVSFDQGEEEMGLRNSPDGDFGELKTYLPGESYHQIAWKHYARTNELYTKVHWGAEHRHYVIPWIGRASELEKNLSQMSAWIKSASDENASFEMETSTSKIEPGRGLEHAKLCWRTLALVKEAR